MSTSEAPAPEPNTLTAALRAIRRRRGLRAHDVALSMGLPLRTYQYFASGRSQLDWERIKAFATATDSDAHAILISVMIGSPDFAVRCMDNKLASVMVAAARRFDARVGDRLSSFEVGRLIAAFRKMFDDLETDLAAREAEAADWLQQVDPPVSADRKNVDDEDL
jgi:hypothetical protein